MIQVRARSENKYSFGPYSEPLAEPIALMVVPYKMNPPTRDDKTNPE